MWKYLILIIAIFFSCKKDEKSEFQTIYPLPYLPVYPGSTWTYVDNNGDTSVQSTSSTYQLHNFKSEELKGALTESVYVPFWNGKAIYGYSTPIDTKTPAFEHYGLNQVGYLSEILGDSMILYVSQYGSNYRNVVCIDTTIIVNSVTYTHVIVVNVYGKMYPYTSKFLSQTSYYAKNIGLIREENYNTSGIISNYINLVNYHINQ